MLNGRKERLPPCSFNIDVLNAAFIKLTTFTSLHSSTGRIDNESVDVSEASKLLKIIGVTVAAKPEGVPPCMLTMVYMFHLKSHTLTNNSVVCSILPSWEATVFLNPKETISTILWTIPSCYSYLHTFEIRTVCHTRPISGCIVIQLIHFRFAYEPLRSTVDAESGSVYSICMISSLDQPSLRKLHTYVYMHTYMYMASLHRQ